ncbi:tetratricopeptide repeat protein [Stakelama tenebrarum]|uniref:Tetratricopeptide repeat protein n=1 Tax=Stakelama tenebrarum TaxID=2711215 RepID=A0A6G6Y5Y3_9SPHN|nr:tetratricopeptide repeat protein [Sphingosinithalassobacter tenebrarum]QIG80342.1 tetratricopeptide repeat protein [Sphingosinithalassobacter tenebrarum]
MCVGGPALAQQADGHAYVRAMAADAEGDVQAAVVAYTRALENAPDDEMVSLRAYRAGLAAGDEALATRAAQALRAGLAPPPDAVVYLLAVAVRDGDEGDIKLLMGEIEGGPFDFMLPTLRAWQAYTRGKDPFPPLDAPADTGLTRRFNIENRALLSLLTGRIDAGSRTIRALVGGGRASEDLQLDGAVLLVAAGHRAEARALVVGEDSEMAAYLQRMGRKKPDLSFGFSRMLLRVAGDLAQEDAVPLSIMLTRTGLLLDPRDDRLRLLLADALSRDGADPVALETLEAIPANSPYADQARIVSVDVLARAGRTEEALEHAREIANRRNASSGDARSYADLLAANGRYDAAALAYALALSRPGGRDDWALHVARGMALDAAGRWDAAVTALRRAVALAPNQPVALDALGRAQIERGVDMAAATAMIERAHELQPDNPAITDSLGWAYYQQGEFARALPLLEAAAKGAPGSTEINEHLGDAYWRMGRRFEARYAWRAAAVYAEGSDKARIEAKLRHGLDGSDD